MTEKPDQQFRKLSAELSCDTPDAWEFQNTQKEKLLASEVLHTRQFNEGYHLQNV